jgi:uncharacterized protein (TIGR04255 family)
MHPKLSKPPVTYVLAQVKFSNIENIESRIPELQEKIRNSFPHYQKVNIQAIQLTEGQQANFASLNQWHFMDKEKHTGIILDNQTLTIHTSCYEQFQSLQGSFKKVVTQFHETLDFSLFTRLGLRYINIINKGDISAINSGLQGFQLVDNGFVKNQFLTKTEANQRSKVGFIKVQATRIANKTVIAGIQNVFVSPELAGIAKLLSFNHYKEPEGEFLVLDLDHFNNDQGDFDTEEILKRLDQLQELIYQAFCQAVGKTNLEKWR